MERVVSREKDNILQIMRAIAIFMVVLQHSIGRVAVTDFENVFMYMLNHIDVPIFFILAGYFFEMKKEKYYRVPILDYCKNKALQLLVPYVFWTSAMALIVYILCSVMPDMASSAGLEKWGGGQYIWNTLTFSDYYLQHLWFAYVIFFFFIINRLIKDVTVHPVFVLIELLIAAILFDMIQIFIVKKFVLHYFNFIFGRIVYKYDLLRIAKSLIIRLLVMVGLCICFTSELLISASFTYTYLGNVLYALCGVITVYNLANYIDATFKWKKPILEIANYSYEIYLSHNPYVVLFVPLVLNKIQVDRGLILIISTTLGIIVPYYVAKLIHKTPVSKLLFGR